MPVSRAEAGEAPAPIAKDVTVRLSEPWSGSKQQPLSLCSIASSLGLLVAATSRGLALYDLPALHETFKTGERNSVPTAAALHTFDTECHVQYIAFADHDARLICALVDGRILVWETASLRGGLSSPQVVNPPEMNSYLLALEPNPGDRSTLCLAIFGPGPTIESSGTAYILDLCQSGWSAPLPCPGVTAVKWSTRGKQLVTGCQSGEIVQLTPEGDIKAKLPPPPEIDTPLYVDDIQWLENHVFLVTYNTTPTSADEPSHEYELYIVLRDSKADHLTYASLPLDVAPPFGDTTWWGKRYTAALRSWASTKHLIFMGCTASTDVGVISCNESSGPGAWNALELEETSRIVLPFSSQDDSSDTAPLGIALDLSAKEPVLDPNAASKGEDPSTTLPPMPLLFIYTSDGVLLGYHIINTDTKDIYAGMLSETQKGTSTSTSAAAAAPAPQSTPTNSAPAFGAVSAFGASNTPTAPAFGSSTAFGTAATSAKPAFGATSAFGAGASSTPAFGATSAFGSSPFTSAPAFGKTSFGSTSQSPGFGAFGGSTSAFSNVSSKSTTNTFGSGSSSSPFGSTGSTFGTNSAFSSNSKSAFGSSAFSSAASKPSAFGSVSSQGNVFGSGGSFSTPQVPVFGQSTPKAAAEKPKNTITQDEISTANDASTRFSFGAIGNILESADQEQKEDQTHDMLEDAAQKPSDTSESEANDSKPEQPGANEPPTSIEPVPDLDKEKVVSATKPEEDEKSVSVSNSDKDDENVKTTESGDPPTKEDADANTSEQLFHVEQSQEVAKSSIEQAETKPSIGTTADDATQDKVVSGLPSKDSMEEKEETATNAISSSTPKADATLVSPIPTSFSSTQPLQEGTKDAKGFSFLKPQEASMSSVTEASTGTESQSSETPPRFARNAQEISKSGLEHTASSFAMPKEETSNATPAFSFSQISSEKPSFPLSKPAETSSKNPELPSNLASSEKTTQQSFVKKEATPTLSLESGSPEAPKTKPGSNNLAADSDKSLSAPSDMPKASPFSSSFGASASQGLFTKSGNAGVVPAFSALSGTKDERPPMWEGLSIKSQTTQKTDQPCPPVNNAKKNEQTGVSLTTPVPQIDLSKPIVTSAPKQNDELETEFVKIYVTLKEELHALKAHADSCSEFFKKLKQPSSTPKQLDEVKDSKSWVFADKDVLDPVARELAQQLQKGVSEVSTVQHRLDGLESTHLKAEIKKDEIARFLRARQDREFAKLVRIRHLGPEHVENQWRLRRMTHVVRERMQELQDFLNSVQRNSSMVKQGMSAMRAPSLDSVHRSADNITRIVMLRLSELEKMERELSMLIPELPREQTPLRATPRPLDTLADLDAVLPSVKHPETEQADPMAYSAAEALLSFRTEPLLTKAGEPKQDTTQTLEQGAIELRQIRQPMQAPQPESKPLELPASEDKPMKATNFLATSTPNGVDYGASTTSPVKPIQSAFRNSTLPLLTSSKGGLVSTSGALPQQYTTFEGLVQPRPVDSETRDLTLEEFVAQEDELDEEEDDDYEDEEDSYNDGYDDYEENDFEDEAD